MEVLRVRLAFAEQGKQTRYSADGSYISARHNFRVGLLDNFFACAHECIEKYLKSILLFNQIATKPRGHNLRDLFETIEEKLDWVLSDFPLKNRQFIDELISRGFDRYCDKQFVFGQGTMGNKTIVYFDQSVWLLRRYSKNTFSSTASGEQNESKLKESERIGHEMELNHLRSHNILRNPCKYKISGGRLEAILENPKYYHARKDLIWKNCCFGKRNRKILKNLPRESILIPGREELPEFYSVADKIKILK